MDCTLNSSQQQYCWCLAAEQLHDAWRNLEEIKDWMPDGFSVDYRWLEIAMSNFIGCYYTKRREVKYGV